MDQHVRELTTSLTALQQQSEQLQRHVQELQTRTDAAESAVISAQEDNKDRAPTFTEFGERVAKILSLADDAYVAKLARAVAGDLGGQVGVAPRIFLKKLVGEVLDRVDQHPDFDPRRHYRLTIADGELSRVERAARGVASVDDVELDL